jgi:hypothetical protein
VETPTEVVKAFFEFHDKCRENMILD